MKGWNSQKDKTSYKYDYSEKTEDVDTNLNKMKDLKISNQAIEKFLNDEDDEGKTKQKAKKTLKCTKCKGSEFYEQDELRKHFKSNWHNFNAKQSAQAKESLSAEEYDEFILMHPEMLK